MKDLNHCVRVALKATPKVLLGTIDPHIYSTAWLGGADWAIRVTLPDDRCETYLRRALVEYEEPAPVPVEPLDKFMTYLKGKSGRVLVYGYPGYKHALISGIGTAFIIDNPKTMSFRIVPFARECDDSDEADFNDDELHSQES
ncbi:MAG: hypothetical protein U0172_03565 [Nitrospiraceae bacterium]